MLLEQDMHLDDINRFFQGGIYNELKNDVSTFNLTTYKLGEVQNLMKLAKVYALSFRLFKNSGRIHFA